MFTRCICSVVLLALASDNIAIWTGHGGQR